jgi:colanic acid/amylovoran biosynthesis glycosyltransferase
VIEKPVVAIYRYILLQHSETFIKNQAEALRNFIPYYVGLRLSRGITVPIERTIVVNRGDMVGRLRELANIFEISTSLASQLKRVAPKLIHAHFGADASLALAVSKQLEIPLVATFHGHDITVEDKYIDRKLGNRIYLSRRELLKKEARLFIAVSNFIRQKLLEHGFPEERILVHYIGVDTALFKAESTACRQPTVLFVGRLVEKKGCEFLIRAMNIVQQSFPEVELIVIGDGFLRSSLETLAQTLLKRYRFLGVQPPQVVQSWMQQASVFCVPSITAQSGDTEAFGLVFAEAQSSGLPVVSFKSGGIPEAVSHEQTGFLAPEKDYVGLAEYISALISNKELWERFSKAGIERIQSQFNLHTQTEKLEKIYASVIEANSTTNKTV